MLWSCKRIRLVLYLLAIPCLAYGAFPATHLTITERWVFYNETYSDEEMRGVILGTLYPDIRYLGEVSRNETHPKNITIEAIAAARTPFEQGVYLHVFLDEERSRLIREWGIYELLDEVAPELPHQDRATFLKLVEDTILSEQRHWLTVQRYLAIVIPEETEGATTMYTALRWHMIVSHYLRDGPVLLLAELTFADKGFLGRSPQLVAKWNELLSETAAHPRIREYVAALVQHFDARFQL